MTKATQSWIALLTVWILWGSTYLGIRLAVGSIPPLLMAGSRFLLAGVALALVLWLALRTRMRPLRVSDLKPALVTAVLLPVIGNGSLCWGEVRIDSGLAALIVATVPMWFLVFDALLSRKMDVHAIPGIAIGAAGMVLLVGMPSAHVPLLPALVMIAGSMSWAFGSVLAGRRQPAHGHPLAPALEMIAGGLLLLAGAALSGEFHAFGFGAVTASSIGGFAWLVVMGSMVAYTAYGFAVRTLPSNVVATYGYVNPIVAVFLGALILHEPVTPNVVFGGATILAAVVIILFVKRRKEEAHELADAA